MVTVCFSNDWIHNCHVRIVTKQLSVTCNRDYKLGNKGLQVGRDQFKENKIQIFKL